MKYRFQVDKVTESLIQFIRDWFDRNGQNCNAIVGISGGKDSTICAKLCVQALGKERVKGVLLPCGYDPDLQLSKEICEYLGIEYYIFNINTIRDYFLESWKSAKYTSKETLPLSEQSLINLNPRIRMTYLRMFAQTYNGRLINTSNLSEDWVGYATIDGDTCGDVSLLSFLTVSEVKKIGHFLGLPNKYVEKVPTDGLVGKTDEENLELKYADIDAYIREGVGNDETVQKIQKKFRDSQFKRNYISGLTSFQPCSSLLFKDENSPFPPCMLIDSRYKDCVF